MARVAAETDNAPGAGARLAEKVVAAFSRQDLPPQEETSADAARWGCLTPLDALVLSVPLLGPLKGRSAREFRYRMRLRTAPDGALLVQLYDQRVTNPRNMCWRSEPHAGWVAAYAGEAAAADFERCLRGRLPEAPPSPRHFPVEPSDAMYRVAAATASAVPPAKRRRVDGNKGVCTAQQPEAPIRRPAFPEPRDYSPLRLGLSGEWELAPGLRLRLAAPQIPAPVYRRLQGKLTSSAKQEVGWPYLLSLVHAVLPGVSDSAARCGALSLLLCQECNGERYGPGETRWGGHYGSGDRVVPPPDFSAERPKPGSYAPSEFPSVGGALGQAFRAVCFKWIADTVGIPCRLSEGSPPEVIVVLPTDSGQPLCGPQPPSCPFSFAEYRVEVMRPISGSGLLKQLGAAAAPRLHGRQRLTLGSFGAPRAPRSALRVLHELGDGATAKVYLARLWERDLALKIFWDPKLGEAELAAARRMGLLSDRGPGADPDCSSLRAVLGMATAEVPQGSGRRAAYMLLEYLPHTAQELLDTPQPMGDVAVVAIGGGRALRYMHSRGFLHRDVKPLNLLIRRDLASGRILDCKLADLGLALPLASARHHSYTQHSGDTHTPGYLAPEVAAGAQGERMALWSEAADVYALGLSLAMLATACPEPTRARQLVLAAQGASAEGSFFARGCLSADPRARPTASQVVDLAEAHRDSAAVLDTAAAEVSEHSGDEEASAQEPELEAQELAWRERLASHVPPQLSALCAPSAWCTAPDPPASGSAQHASEQYNREHLLPAEEPMMDGFIDPGRTQELRIDEDYEYDPSVAREVLLLDARRDGRLRQARDLLRLLCRTATYEARCLLAAAAVYAFFPVPDGTHGCEEKFAQYMEKHERYLHREMEITGQADAVWPMQLVHFSQCRHISLLYKYFAGVSGVPAALVRGFKDTNGHAWVWLWGSSRTDSLELLKDAVQDRRAGWAGPELRVFDNWDGVRSGACKREFRRLAPAPRPGQRVRGGSLPQGNAVPRGCPVGDLSWDELDAGLPTVALPLSVARRALPVALKCNTFHPLLGLLPDAASSGDGCVLRIASHCGSLQQWLAAEGGEETHSLDLCVTERRLRDGLAAVHRGGFTHGRVTADSVLLRVGPGGTVAGSLLWPPPGGLPDCAAAGPQQDREALEGLLRAAAAARNRRVRQLLPEDGQAARTGASGGARRWGRDGAEAQQ
eukprot:TRINITY_DN7455_c0_g1_i1.p1 TRINITY_DN7455_c0_g1~~TRINITY_DN7455_c0_g1_i1.p1  ORF type:complete len:1244 (+),score=224.23 TRINITY_DN7455_c0_g1_i1:118-3732(+)